MAQRRRINTGKDYMIFFVDDEPAVRKAVAQSLAHMEDCKVRCFESAESCLGQLQSEQCHLLITDINMPGMDGMGLLEAVGRIRPGVSVLLVTGYGDIPTAVKAVRGGAKDFIEKPLDEDSFLAKVRQILEEDSVEDAKLRGQKLTKIEIEVLRHIVKGKSNKEIAHDACRSVRTIENHRHRLMRKLGTDGTAGLVKIAIKMGLAE